MLANEPDYLVLDEALQKKLARVTEVSEGGSVLELAFENFADQSVLLLYGEELVGARQNRILNITVLVGAQQKIMIPVSCVEHDHRRYNSAEYTSADRALLSRRARTRRGRSRRHCAGTDRAAPTRARCGTRSRRSRWRSA